MKCYINDTTLNKVLYFDDVNQLVTHLETVCLRKFKQTRKNWMFEMSTLGHGWDDPQGANFTELMMTYFEVGTVKPDGRHVRTNIHELSRNLKYRKEMGD